MLRVVEKEDGIIYALKLCPIENEKKVLREYRVLSSLGDKCKQGLVCYHELFYAYEPEIVTDFPEKVEDDPDSYDDFILKNDLDLAGPKVYICVLMDFVQGIDLDMYIRTNPVVNDEQMIVFMKHMLKILQMLHSKGYVHRDIKPANIFSIRIK